MIDTMITFMPIRLCKRHGMSENTILPFFCYEDKNSLLDFTYMYIYKY